MIKIENLNYKYDESGYIIKDINLEIKEGEFVSIIGKNGCGKSTLAKLISGIINPTTGKITVDDIDVSNKRKYIDLRKKVGIVFQNPENQIVFNKVYDDIVFALNNLKLDNESIKIEEALKKVSMEKYLDCNTYELSLGQKQRVTIASVLAVNPKYLIFDEPTTMLDSEGKEAVYSIISNLKKEGYTIIYITNLMEEILLSDKIFVMENGQIVNSFKKEDIMDNIDILLQKDIKLPMLIKMLVSLKDQGLNINLKELTTDGLVNELVRLCKK